MATQEKKRKAEEGLKVVKITVQEDFVLPNYYVTASPAEAERALLEGAALQVGNPALIRSKIEAAIQQAKQEHLMEREAHVSASEDRLASILEEYRLQLQDLRTQMQDQKAHMEAKLSEKDAAMEGAQNASARQMTEMEAQARELKERISVLVKQNDELEESLAEAPVETHEKSDLVRQHFMNHGKHSNELCKLYQKHHELIKQLDRSMTEIRAKEYVFYKESKRINQSEGLHAHMNLSFELSADYVRDKMVMEGKAWNDIKHSAREDIERDYHKESFMMIVKQDKGKPDKANELRTWIDRKTE